MRPRVFCLCADFLGVGLLAESASIENWQLRVIPSITASQDVDLHNGLPVKFEPGAALRSHAVLKLEGVEDIRELSRIDRAPLPGRLTDRIDSSGQVLNLNALNAWHEVYSPPE